MRARRPIFSISYEFLVAHMYFGRLARRPKELVKIASLNGVKMAQHLRKVDLKRPKAPPLCRGCMDGLGLDHVLWLVEINKQHFWAPCKAPKISRRLARHRKIPYSIIVCVIRLARRPKISVA